MTNLAGEHLVDGNAGPDIGSAFLQTHAGKKHAITARVIARTVGSWIGADMVQTAHYLNQLAALFQGFQGRAQCEFLFFLRPPL